LREVAIDRGRRHDRPLHPPVLAVAGAEAASIAAVIAGDRVVSAAD
jgi:hypothetical protein